MIETPLYTSIEMDYPNGKVCLWQFHQINENCRIHYKFIEEDDKGLGFNFCSIKWTGNVCNDEPDQWKNETTTVEVLLHGVVMWDGLRHLYFGTEESKNRAYFFYPDMDEIYLIMKKIVEMEQEYCSESDERKYFGSPLETTKDEK